MYQFRHGDLLIECVASIPASATERKNGVLALGETTGHAHVLQTGRLMPAVPTPNRWVDDDGTPVDEVAMVRPAPGYELTAPARGNLVLETQDGEVYLSITEDGAIVTHEEHHAIALPKGEFRVTYQQEYRPFDQAAARVAD